MKQSPVPEVSTELFDNLDVDVIIHPVEPAVFPSNKLSVASFEGDGYKTGAHKYVFINCRGFENGESQYANTANTEDKSEKEMAEILQTIQFVHKLEDGTIIPGLQSEQVVIALLDRTNKLNEKYPSPQNVKMIAGLSMFLEACQERIEDRMSRGVMGKLEK